MTLLDLAHHLHKSIQEVCKLIKEKTGVDILCSWDSVIDSSIVQIVAPNYSKKNTYGMRLHKNDFSGNTDSVNKNKRAWAKIAVDYHDGKEVTCEIVDKNSGGYLVDLYGISCFLPNSQIDLNGQDENYIGKVSVIVIEFELYNKVVVSNKVLENRRLRQNSVYNGEITKIENGKYILVRLSTGQTGVVFPNEISWEKIDDYNKIYSIGDDVWVLVYGISSNFQTVYLSIKRLEPNPINLRQEYDSINEGDDINVTIERVENWGVLAKYQKLLCKISKTDLFWGIVEKIADHINVGDQILARVISKEISEEGKFRVNLSQRECLVNPWTSSVYSEGQEVSGPITSSNGSYFKVKISYGVEGILHKNNMSKLEFEALQQWSPEHGDVNLIIQDVDPLKKRIILATPSRTEIEYKWQNIFQYYQINDTYPATFISFEDNLLWVQLEDGIEASIASDELNWKNSKSMQGTDFKFGDKLKINIIQIDQDRRRIYASVKRLTPNPWDVAGVQLKKGDILIVKVITCKEKFLLVETQDSYHLIGKVRRSELSWFPLKEEEIPQEGWLLEAKIMVFRPEKEFLMLSVRCTMEDPWKHVFVGAELKGLVIERNDDSSMQVQLDNKLYAITYDKELLSLVGRETNFKIMECNRAKDEIVVSHENLIFDRKNENIVKSFFN